MKRRGLLGGAAGLLLTTAAQAQQPRASALIKVERVNVVEAGRYEGRSTRRSPAENSPTGVNERVAEVKLVDSSLRIPGKVGVLFGVRFQVSGSPAGETATLREVWRLPLPGARNPANGRVFLETSYDFKAIVGQIAFRGYGFDHEWEIVPGEWMIEIWDGVRKMAMHRFTVVAA
jgi:hypothetical protein